MIRIERLTRRYGETLALDDVTLEVAAGDVTGLLGPNGAGKTTLVETLEGLRVPTSGTVRVLGLDPGREARALRERIGVQLQSTAVPLDLTPLETLRLFGAFFRKALPPQEVLQRTRLADQARVRNSALSGGQRQRLAVAMALINDPELVILDEPTSGLDPAARRELHRDIAEMKSAKRTVLLSTHYIEEAEKLCDRVILLRAGKVVADGSPAQLIENATGAAELSIVLAGTFDPAPLLNAGAVAHEREGDRQRFTAANPDAAMAALSEVLRTPGAKLVDVRMKRPSLEDVYLQLVGDAPARPGDEP
ncbi:MAG: ABC transporter ATP-binding protein [Thermoanaerobaculia bacterium]